MWEVSCILKRFRVRFKQGICIQTDSHGVGGCEVLVVEQTTFQVTKKQTLILAPTSFRYK